MLIKASQISPPTYLLFKLIALTFSNEEQWKHSTRNYLPLVQSGNLGIRVVGLRSPLDETILNMESFSRQNSILKIYYSLF